MVSYPPEPQPSIERSATSSSSPPQATDASMEHANRHIPAFLRLPFSHGHKLLQTLTDGSLLTAENLRCSNSALSLQRPILVTDQPSSIGMRLPRQNTVRNIADLVGHDTPVHVIDVEFQEEMKGWTFGDLVEYFEDEHRLMAGAHKTRQQQSSTTRPARRAKTVQIRDKTPHRVLNQISYEFSRTPLLASKVKSPAFVRQLDWIDTAWPRKVRDQGIYPVVQYYCLTSAAGCYTDFHLDFGGTSVWYHVLAGAKEFCLIPPTPQNLQAYEEWLCRPDQAVVFLPEMLQDAASQVLRVKLEEGQTMIIPAGWIHSVYTPVDSLVFGGNFLHGLDMEVQLDVYAIEVRTKVLDRFRFPYFKTLQFYAGGMYLEKLRRGDVCAGEVEGLSKLAQCLQSWWNVRSDEGESQPGTTVEEAALYAAKQNKCKTVHSFLEALKSEVARVKLHGIAPAPVLSLEPTVTKSTAPKIRLKISSPALKKHLLKVPKSVIEVKPLPWNVQETRPRRPREDFSTSLVDEQELLRDDEWVPDAANLVQDLIVPVSSKSASRRESVPSSPRPKRQKKTTARQRLFKKTR